MNLFIHLSAIIILPLIPAFILYKFLPSTAVVKGPFKGFNINLSGAFGGYFLLVLIAEAFIVFSLKSNALHQYDIWKITGKINEKSGVALNINPPAGEFQVDSDGRFEVNVMVKPGLVEGVLDWPTLIFTKKGYTTITRNLDYIKKTLEDDQKTVFLNEDIFLEKFKDDSTSIP